MSFRIQGLEAARFAGLHRLDDEGLAMANIARVRVSQKPSAPCRICLDDAEIGELVLLLNYEHLPVPGPYRSRHAIYVREHAVEYTPQRNEIPELLRSRLLSVRAYDTSGMMVDAEVVSGADLAPVIERQFAEPIVAFVHLHNAKPGCFAASVQRA